MADFQTLSEWLETQVDGMVALQAELTRRPAIGPENEGRGEWEKAQFLEEYLAGCGIGDVRHHDSPDERVPEGTRPNFVAALPGLQEKPCVWVLTHLDVVPPGEQKADGTWKDWHSDPFTLRREGDLLFGRGVTDNQQSIVSSVFAARALLENDLTPPHPVRLLFVADEETGSALGLDYMLRGHGDQFSPEDIIIVPDAGNEDGSLIEVAEKSVLWIEVNVRGKQAHGSVPQRGLNAFRAASRLVCRLDEALAARFDAGNELFRPPRSTFEPTLHAANVPNVNTIPGEDLFCMDCRVLPDYGLDGVLECMREQCRKIDDEMSTRTEVKVRNRMDAPPATPADAPVVGLLQAAIREVLALEPETAGIGGMTVASFFRRHGLPAACWMTSGGTEHQANESCAVGDMLGDARVFAHVFSRQF